MKSSELKTTSALLERRASLRADRAQLQKAFADDPRVVEVSFKAVFTVHPTRYANLGLVDGERQVVFDFFDDWYNKQIALVEIQLESLGVELDD